MSPEEIAKLRRLAQENGILPLGSADEISDLLNSDRPRVRLPGDDRELIHFAIECGEILRRRDFYRRDRTPVGINHEKARLDPITPQALRTMSQRHLVFFKDKSVGSGKDTRLIEVVRTMNVDQARGLLEAWDFIDQLPEIDRVNPIQLPTLRRDGRIELAPVGYCPESRIYTLRSDVVLDDSMTFDQAREVISDLLSEFPFHDGGRSLAVQVAAMMTVFGACLLPKGAPRPGFVYTANDSDAGKTLASKVAIIPIHGKANIRAMPRKEETRKVLDQLAMQASTTVVFDNVRGTLGGEEIEAFMSAARWEGRVLGESTGFEVDNITTCFFTGNEAKPTRDMAQRCLFVELFLEQLDSSARTIRRVLDDATLAAPGMRSSICSALWAFVKHWDAEGRPAALSAVPKCPAWSQTIAAIVTCAGFGDPCAKPDIRSARSGAQEMQDLVRACAPDAPATQEDWTFPQIMDAIKECGLFESLEVIGKKGDRESAFDEEGNVTPAARSYFGKFFLSFAGRLFVGEDGEALRWVVEGKGHSRKYLVVREDAPPAPSSS